MSGASGRCVLRANCGTCVMRETRQLVTVERRSLVWLLLGFALIILAVVGLGVWTYLSSGQIGALRAVVCGQRVVPVQGVVDRGQLRRVERLCGVRAGARGLPGARGVRGVVGSRGVRGVAGARGSRGAVGVRGPRGPAGRAGPQGPRGERGPVGVGARGPAGRQGERGPAGPAGPAGVRGPAGPLGPVGPAGAPGPSVPLSTVVAEVCARLPVHLCS